MPWRGRRYDRPSRDGFSFVPDPFGRLRSYATGRYRSVSRDSARIHRYVTLNLLGWSAESVDFTTEDIIFAVWRRLVHQLKFGTDRQSKIRLRMRRSGEEVGVQMRSWPFSSDSASQEEMTTGNPNFGKRGSATRSSENGSIPALSLNRRRDITHLSQQSPNQLAQDSLIIIVSRSLRMLRKNATNVLDRGKVIHPG